MQIGSAYASRLDSDEYLVPAHLRNRDVVYDQTGLRGRLADGLHRFGHVISPCMCNGWLAAEGSESIDFEALGRTKSL